MSTPQRLAHGECHDEHTSLAEPRGLDDRTSQERRAADADVADEAPQSQELTVPPALNELRLLPLARRGAPRSR